MANDSKTSEYEQKLWDYIATLEAMNQTLLDTVKQCVKILIPFKNFLPCPTEWEEALDIFQDTIKEAQKVA